MWLSELVSYYKGSDAVMLQGKHIKALVTYVAHTSNLHIKDLLEPTVKLSNHPVKQKLVWGMKQYILYKNFGKALHVSTIH